MSSDQCTIPPNPDVSGIGVRYAIYIQNILCFVPVVMNLVDDGKISADELKGIQDQSVGMLAIAFSILITTIILAEGAGGDQGITNYHASIVLDLSWMNNTSTWIWFILYVHCRSKPKSGAPVPATWRAWYNLLRGRGVKGVKAEKEGKDSIIHRQLHPGLRRGTGRGERRREGREETRKEFSYTRTLTNTFRFIWSAASKYPVLTLGSFHLSLMAAVGMWLWSNPSNFGQRIPCSPTIEVVTTPAQLSSRPLEVASLIFYSLFLIPVLNLCLPFLFFLALHIFYNWFRNLWEKAKNPHLQDPEAALGVDYDHGKTSDSQPHTAFLVVGLLCLLAINIIFILDIELTLRLNQANQTGGD
jgi:hypothetical protein